MQALYFIDMIYNRARPWGHYTILAKLYGIFLEEKIILWIESHGKGDKGQVGFKRYHSIVDHLVTFKITAEEFCNTKTNLFLFFVEFRKYFDTFPRKKL
jgi:hypothetical protein